MKILYVISSIDISAGGPSKSVSDLAVNMMKAGQDVTLITGDSPDPYLIESNKEGLKIRFVKSESFKRILNSSQASSEFDLLHGHGLWQLPVHYMSSFARNRKIPYIISPRGMLEPWALNNGRLKKRIALWGYQRKDIDLANCLHATSLLEAGNLRKFGIENPVAIIPNGLDLSEYQLTKTEFKKEKKKVFFFSRIHPKKGIEVLIEAWQNLNITFRKDWNVEIAGNGDEKYILTLKKLISNSGLDGEIEVSGPKYGESKYMAFSQADLFVLPTYSENFGLVIAEAMAFSIPVITTKGTPWEEINTYNAGCWIDIGVEPLVEALEKMLGLSDSERSLIGLNGRKLVEKNYSIGSTVSKMGILYEWVLKGGKRPEFLYK